MRTRSTPERTNPNLAHAVGSYLELPLKLINRYNVPCSVRTARNYIKKGWIYSQENKSCTYANTHHIQSTSLCLVPKAFKEQLKVGEFASLPPVTGQDTTTDKSLRNDLAASQLTYFSQSDVVRRISCSTSRMASQG